MTIFRFLFHVHFLLLSAAGLQPIITPHEFFIGWTINATCDYQTLNINPAAQVVETLILLRKTWSDSNFTKIAVYNPFLKKNITTSIPPGRDWNITFSGGENNDNNIQTIRINLFINDAVCSDVGLYKCVAHTDVDELPTESPVQNLTADGHVSQEPLVMVPDNKNGPNYSENEVGDNITLTCTAYGPDDLILTWKYTTKESKVEKNSNLMDITRADPVVKSTNGPCILWKLETTLSFPFLETDDGNTFICIVYDHTTEFMRENFTIGVLAPTEAPSTGSSKLNVGGIIGGVIAGVIVAYILIMVLYCIYCKKCLQKNPDSENPDGITQDAGRHTTKLKRVKSAFSSIASSEWFKSSKKEKQDAKVTKPENDYDYVTTGRGQATARPASAADTPKKVPINPRERETSQPSHDTTKTRSNLYVSQGGQGSVNIGFNSHDKQNETSTDDNLNDKVIFSGVDQDSDASSPRVYNREDRAQRRRSRNNEAALTTPNPDGVSL
nr:hypothetical protein BgiMline_019073 [Biomphalaria glabrata]